MEGSQMRNGEISMEHAPGRKSSEVVLDSTPISMVGFSGYSPVLSENDVAPMEGIQLASSNGAISGRESSEVAADTASGASDPIEPVMDMEVIEASRSEVITVDGEAGTSSAVTASSVSVKSESALLSGGHLVFESVVEIEAPMEGSQLPSSNGAISGRESSEVSSRTTRWALLCGGNYYCEGNARDIRGKKIKYPPLNGCVNDVIAIETFLQSIGIPEGNITKLTASHCDGKTLEDEGAWPTYNNFVRELNRIAGRAERGDLVYIHYSGHGIRRNVLQLEDEGGDPSKGMALVMTDVLTGGAYLTGFQLGVFVRKMVQEKGLRVTLVLDSCFSGRGFRRHEFPGLRTVVGQHDESMLPSDQEAYRYANEAKRGFSDRDANVTTRCWMSNPTGCTILTACEVNQIAHESLFGESELMQGVFTHWMLDILQKTGNHLPSHARVRDHVAAQVKQMVPAWNQSPMIFGEGRYEFFGSVFLNRCRHEQKISGNRIYLDIGSAQNAAVGAIYDVYPRNWDSEGETGLRAPFKAHVIEVSTFQSTALLAEDANVDTDTDCRAILRRWALPNDVFVVLPKIDNPDIRGALETELEKTPGMHLWKDGDEEGTFTVVVDAQKTFEVYQKDTRVPRLPRISIEDRDGITRLGYVLSHLARYQALEKLCNTARSEYIRSDEFVFEIRKGVSILEEGAFGRFDVVENEILTLTFTYKGSLKKVWLSLFSFNASWSIEKVEPHPDSGQVAIAMAPNKRSEDLILEFVIPKKSRDGDPSDIKDKFVAFVCDGDDPPSWDEICLPEFPIDGSSCERSLAEHKIRKVERSIKRNWTVLQRVVYTRPNLDGYPFQRAFQFR